MSSNSQARNIRDLLGLFGLVVVGVVGAGVLYGFSTTQWLSIALGMGIVLWVGGAVTGQIVLARLLDTGATSQAIEVTRALLRIIPAFYVPASFVALGSGVSLALIHDIDVLGPAFLIPVTLVVLTSVVGGTVSAPGYSALLRSGEAEGADHPDVRARMTRLLWVNRIELVLVLALGATSVVQAFG